MDLSIGYISPTLVIIADYVVMFFSGGCSFLDFYMRSW